MKKFKTAAACALALILGCVPLAACGDTDNNGAAADEEEFETYDPVTDITPPQTEPDEPEIEITDPEEIPEDPEEEQSPEETPGEEPDEPEEEAPEVAAPAAETTYVYIHANGLNVRSGAGTSYSSLGTVESDILMPYTGQVGNWYETRYKNRTAYVSADSRYTSLTTLGKADDAVESVIAEGLNFMGVPYVYGAVRYHDGNGNRLSGFTDTAFDCSSLMQYIFYKGAGVLLNVTSRTQVTQGTAVAKADIRRGDLLFFTNATRKDYTGIERVGHVALYLGDNYILHTSSDYAKIEQISATRWSYFITARRVL